MATLLDWGNVDAAAAQIEKTLNLETRREAFSLLCVTSLLRIDFDEARGSITDGGEDRGVDAVYLDERFGRRVIHLFQFKCHSKFNGSNRNFPSTEIDKLLAFIGDCFGQVDGFLDTCNPLLRQKVLGQQAFLNAPVDRRTVAADRVAAPASPNILQAGAVISAALITGIRSDLPGQITAQVTENIYDSPTGRILLVPQGTRIIGQYDNNVQFGQSRVLLVWNRLIFPNGRSIVLERQPGTDAEGYAGLQDGVDYHWWDLAKAAGLSTLLSVGAELAANDDDRLIQAIRNGGQDTINDAGQQIVRRQLNIAPTLTIRPGFPVRVVVTRDLVLEPYGGQ